MRLRNVPDYNLLGNVHWLELNYSDYPHQVDYNLLGNVHWLEPQLDGITIRQL